MSAVVKVKLIDEDTEIDGPFLISPRQAERFGLYIDEPVEMNKYMLKYEVYDTEACMHEWVVRIKAYNDFIYGWFIDRIYVEGDEFSEHWNNDIKELFEGIFKRGDAEVWCRESFRYHLKESKQPA